MKWLLLALLFACRAAAGQAEHLPEFRHSAEIALEGQGAIYAFELSAEFHRGLERRDLGDLRVLNGAGEVVPYALLRAAASERKPAAPLTVSFFPLHGPPGRPIEDLALRVERKADGTLSAVVAPGKRRTEGRRLLGYVIDASPVAAAVRELRFDWPAGPEGTSVSVRVEASDDLRAWRTVATGPLIVLRQGELLLERRAIELPPTKAKYFRVAWRPGDEALRLAGVVAAPVEAVAEAPRSWLRIAAVAGARPGEFLFELPLSLPVDRLRFELPNENTVASASIAVQERAGGPERILRSTVLYRMDHRGEKLHSPDIEIAPTAAPRWVMRVDQRGGGLGGGLPAMQAGWLPHRLVFVARGAPPFRAAFGNAEAQPAALAVQSLVPGYDPQKPLPALVARPGPIRSRERVQPEPADALRSYFERIDRKAMGLWGSLLLGVLVIVGMAWRLTRLLPPPGVPDKRFPPRDEP